MTLTLHKAAAGRPCHYCGVRASGRNLHRDHFRPRSKGGKDTARNLVYACGSCNSTKGDRLFAVARTNLMFRRLGWPRFNPEQLAWLKSKGFDLSPLENGKLHFEESGQ